MGQRNGKQRLWSKRLIGLAYCEGDGQVDLVSNVGDVSLSEETRQANLGAVWRDERFVSRVTSSKHIYVEYGDICKLAAEARKISDVFSTQ